jgi:hypothetical protein
MGGSNRDARWVTSTDSAFFGQVDYFRSERWSERLSYRSWRRSSLVVPGNFVGFVSS